MNKKQCTLCMKIQPHNEFYRVGKYRRNKCRTCVNATSTNPGAWSVKRNHNKPFPVFFTVHEPTYIDGHGQIRGVFPTYEEAEEFRQRCMGQQLDG